VYNKYLVRTDQVMMIQDFQLVEYKEDEMMDRR